MVDIFIKCNQVKLAIEGLNHISKCKDVQKPLQGYWKFYHYHQWQLQNPSSIFLQRTFMQNLFKKFGNFFLNGDFYEEHSKSK